MKRLHTFLSFIKPGESPSTMNPVNPDPVFALGSGSVRAKTKYLNMTSLCKIPVKVNKISPTYKIYRSFRSDLHVCFDEKYFLTQFLGILMLFVLCRYCFFNRSSPVTSTQDMYTLLFK